MSGVHLNMYESVVMCVDDVISVSVKFIAFSPLSPPPPQSGNITLTLVIFI